MSENQDKGQICFTAALEAGEKLYPNTSPEGREIIRQELRTLRESWECYVDGVGDAQRRLDRTLVLWQTYGENYDHLMKWLKEMEHALTCDVELKNTLSEKKAMLQHCRVKNCNTVIKSSGF